MFNHDKSRLNYLRGACKSNISKVKFITTKFIKSIITVAICSKNIYEKIKLIHGFESFGMIHGSKSIAQSWNVYNFFAFTFLHMQVKWFSLYIAENYPERQYLPV